MHNNILLSLDFFYYYYWRIQYTSILGIKMFTFPNFCSYNKVANTFIFFYIWNMNVYESESFLNLKSYFEYIGLLLLNIKLSFDLSGGFPFNFRMFNDIIGIR